MVWRHIFEWLVNSPQLRIVARGCFKALAIGVVFYFIMYLLERASGATTQQYHSRGFWHDVVYWFYYRSGLDNLLFTAAFFSFLAPRLAFLQLAMVNSLPPVLRAVLWIVVADFMTYWVHRLQHASPFVWAFHSTHHAQEQLNFATAIRFHPVDHFISDSLKFVPQFMLGASPLSWLPLYLTMEFIVLAEHSRIGWQLDWLSKIIVTPKFHSFHHSTDPRHHNKNFGGLLTIWDRLFRTALDDPERPAHYGLPDIKMPTLSSTFLLPFRLLIQRYAVGLPSSNNVRNARPPRPRRSTPAF